jgi:uncharacterized Fe-S cluster protein YjdI
MEQKVGTLFFLPEDGDRDITKCVAVCVHSGQCIKVLS